MGDSLLKFAAINDADLAKRKHDAQALREFADGVEKGEIIDFAFVANDKVNQRFIRMVTFEDRWRILGALEYAKDGVHACD